MDKSKTLFSNFSITMDLFALFVLLSFFLMVKPVNDVYDIVHHNGYLYVAVGRRGIQVLDIQSNPRFPREIDVYDTSGTAKAMTVSNREGQSFLYVAVARKGIEVYRILDDGRLKFEWQDTSLKPAHDIAVRGKYGYVASGKRGLVVSEIDQEPDGEDLFRRQIKQFQPGLVSAEQDGRDDGSAVDLEGVNQVVISAGRAYIIDDAWILHVFDLFSPENPQHLVSLPIEQPVNDIFIDDRIGYIATNGAGMILVDLRFPAGNEIIARYEDSKNIRSVSVYGPFAFVSGGDGSIKILEISKPVQEIVRIAEFKRSISGEIQPFDVTDDGEKLGAETLRENIDAQKLVQVGDYLYYSDGKQGIKAINHELNFEIKQTDVLGGIGEDKGWGEEVVVVENQKGDEDRKRFAYIIGRRRGLWILDVTDPFSPVDVTERVDRTGIATAIASRGDYLYIGYNNRGLRIDSIANPGANENQIDFELNQEIKDISVVDDNYVYLATGPDGFRVIEISSPELLRGVGHEETPGNASGLYIQDDHAFVADGQSGLQVINIRDRQKPTLVAGHETGFEAVAIAVHQYRRDDASPVSLFAYLAIGSGGVAIFDVSNPQNPILLDGLETGEFAQDVFLQNGFLYVTDRKDGVLIFDLENPQEPVLRGRYPTPGQASGIYVMGDFAYVADYDRGLRIINIANKDDPREYGRFDTPTEVVDLIIANENLAYLADNAGFWTISLENFSNPTPIDLLKTPYGINSITLDPFYLDPSNQGASPQYAYITISDEGIGSDQGFNRVAVVDVAADIQAPRIVGTYNELQDVRDIDVRDDYAFVADGEAGVRVLDISELDGIKEVAVFGIQGDARSVDIAGNYMYVASGISQIEIANIIDPENPTMVRPVTPLNTIIADTRKIDLMSDRELAYISAGENGLYVIDINQPLDPKILFDSETPDQLLDIALSPHYAFLADGAEGVGVVYMPEARTFIAKDSWYFPFPSLTADDDIWDTAKCEAVAIDVLPHIIKRDQENKPSLHYYVYVATKQCGLLTLEYTMKMDLAEGGLASTPGDANLLMIAGSYINLIKESIQLIWKKSAETNVGYGNIFRLAFLVFRGKIAALDPRIKDTSVLYLFGVFVFTVNIFYWLGLIVHFILPVRRPQESWIIFKRLFLFFRGMHGPIVNVREGQEHVEIQQKDSPGVALIDLNSAIVVEEYPATNPNARSLLRQIQKQREKTGESKFQAKAEGPGVIFLQPYERIRGVADLRKQIRMRSNVKGFTQDGIEVSTDVFILFTLGEPPDVKYVTYIGEEIAENLRWIDLSTQKIPISDKEKIVRSIDIIDNIHEENLDQAEKNEIHQFVQKYKYGSGGSTTKATAFDRSQKGPYLFDELRVFDAIISKPYDIKERQVREWTELPAHVAAAEFRNSIGKETYNSLFEPQSPTKYQINHFKQNLARRIQHMGVIAYQFVENMDGSQMQTGQTWEKSKLKFSERRNLQTPKPLRSRGIKVISVGFSELEPTHQDVSSHLTNYWRSEWQKETAMIEADFELQAARLKSFAGAEIQTDLVNTLGMILEDRPLPKEVLSFKVFQALEAAASDPETRRLLPEEVIQMLSEIRNLLLPEDSTEFLEDSTEKIDSATSSQESVDEDKPDISDDLSNDRDTGYSSDLDRENS